MVSVGISKLGCTDLVFVDPGIKDQWRLLPPKHLLPVMREVSGEFFRLSTGQCLSTLAPNTVRLLEQRRRSFHRIFCQQTTVDYRIWSVIQQRVYSQSPVHDTAELKQCVQQMWRNVDQSIIDSAIDEWRKRVRAGERRTLRA